MLAAKHESVVDVRGMGLMLAMEMNSADLAKQVVAKMLERRILINRTSETVLRFLPPYIMGREHVDMAVSRIERNFERRSSGPVWRGASKHKGATEWLAKLSGRGKGSTSGEQACWLKLRDARRARSVLDRRSFPAEIAAIMELAHAIKASPADYRYSLDAGRW